MIYLSYLWSQVQVELSCLTYMSLFNNRVSSTYTWHLWQPGIEMQLMRTVLLFFRYPYVNKTRYVDVSYLKTYWLHCIIDNHVGEGESIQ